MSSEISKVENKMPTPMDLLQAAVANKVDADQLSKLMDLQERWQANEARRAFAVAISDFQAVCPTIRKNKRGEKSTYADLEHVVNTIKPLMRNHGLSARFDTELTFSGNGEAQIMTATCYITHISGHTESNQFACPVDIGPTNSSGKRVMNSAQSTASARSYCKRYALGDALNLVFADDVDDDAASVGAPSIEMATDEQMATINDYLEADSTPEVTKEFIRKRGTFTRKQAQTLIDKLNKETR